MKLVKTLDGNEAAVDVAYRLTEVCAIYPITPSSTMGELAEYWAHGGRKNLWGSIPLIAEMQSEGGAAGAVHGALQTGALTTTFTASQGLLLMIPNMYKIAGELTPCVIHVAARSLAAQALSIFGDHSDVMAARATGFAMLASSSVQEAHDMALVAHAVTLRSRIPFIHFFDGFRTSHEVAKIDAIADDVLAAMIHDEDIFAHRERALNPEKPVIKGTTQNPDVYFQGRESVNPYYETLPELTQAVMDELATHTGRAYKVYEYYGNPHAEDVLVIMGSGAETVKETLDAMEANGIKAGMLQVRLYRPFDVDLFIKELPATMRRITVLDRTKEPGALGEPLLQDVTSVMVDAVQSGKWISLPMISGGRYGLSSKEFTPAMVMAVFTEMKKPKGLKRFTVGIKDDVSGTSLEYSEDAWQEDPNVYRALFYGLGSDGTVGANKNTIKIVGEETDFNVQGYFVYDSKKSGSRTTSHLRFSKTPIRSSYLIRSANFVACHQNSFVHKVDVLRYAAEGSTLLLNSPVGADRVWESFPIEMQETIIAKKISVYVIDALAIAAQTGMGTRINTIMQTCFFALSGFIPREDAIAQIKESIRKTYARKGDDVVQKNFVAVDFTLEHLFKVEVPASVTAKHHILPAVPEAAPAFVKDVLGMILADRGDELPVSAFPADGVYPTGTSKWEKRNISPVVAQWNESICTQCGNCTVVCPHAAIRTKSMPESSLASAPAGFKNASLRGNDDPSMRFSLQVYAEDCTGCNLCVEVCPVPDRSKEGFKAINLVDKDPILEQAKKDLEFFETLPVNNRCSTDVSKVRGVQFLEPLFEFSGACTGCGETPYIKMVTQLYGDRMLVANATGCSSIFGGNLPTTPYTKNADGRGPAWCNSLFEDNAEFGFGYSLTREKHLEMAWELLDAMRDQLPADLITGLKHNKQDDELEIAAQRERVEELRNILSTMSGTNANRLASLSGAFLKKSIWIIGGDGWAYDIGFGGLDHVLASGRNVNIMVLDTETYSNTGGQASKSTPRGASAKFATGGKPTAKKDLALMAISYGSVYVARISMGANPAQAIKAIREAEAYDGPSLVIGYGHCISHGIEMESGLKQQKKAVDSGHWPLFRYNPELDLPMVMDSKKPKITLKDYALTETRYSSVMKENPAAAEVMLQQAQDDINRSWTIYENLASAR
jgi:pyruvate-ferredoxin/flavodoxin oxidoreductase